jgi:Lon protease-like protein
VIVDQQKELPLFPLHTVLFPGMMLPLHIFEERYKLMISECVRDSQPFGVVLLRSGQESGRNATIYDTGTTAHITQVEQLGDGRMNIATLGHSRFRIQSTHNKKPYMTGLIHEFPLLDTENAEAKQIAALISPMLQEYLDIIAKLGNVELEMSTLPEDPSTLAYLTAIVMRAPMQDKQRLLDIPDLPTMLQVERRILRREVQILKMLIEQGPRWRDDPNPFSAN